MDMPWIDIDEWYDLEPMSVCWCSILIFVVAGSATTNIDMCSNTTNDFSSESEPLSFVVKDINTMSRDCSCEITTERNVSVCLAYTCSSCQSSTDCKSNPCSCTEVDFTISPTCIKTINNRICPPSNSRQDSCQTSTKFTLNLSRKPSIPCSTVKTSETLVLTIQPKAFGK